VPSSTARAHLGELNLRSVSMYTTAPSMLQQNTTAVSCVGRQTDTKTVQLCHHCILQPFLHVWHYPWQGLAPVQLLVRCTAARCHGTVLRILCAPACRCIGALSHPP
jgi:hypothetical protein